MAGSSARRARVLRIATACTLLIVVLAWATAQGTPAPEVVWIVSTDAADLPDQIAPGYTLFTLQNDSEGHTGLTVFRMLEGTTVEAFAEVSGRVDEAMAGPPSPAALDVLNEGLALVDILGGVDAEPGETRSYGVVLHEGHYVLEFTSDGPSQYRALRVEGAFGGDAPTTDATVHMVDFAFAMPAGMKTGPQTWYVTNVGEQLHHMAIFRLVEGATLEQFMESPESVAMPAAYIGMISAGQGSYHFLDFEPGNYVAVCFLADHIGDASGMPHFMLGMVQEFAVGP